MLQDAKCSRWAVCAVVLTLVSIAAAQSSFVRVNQVGYVSGAAKRAYLMSSASEAGATFVVKNSGGTTVFGPAAIGPSLGSWGGSYSNVYAIDFDAVMTAGAYSIAVSGPMAFWPMPW